MASLAPLLLAVMVRLAERLQFAAPKQQRVAAMRLDVVGDEAAHLAALLQAEGAMRLGLELLRTSAVRPGPSWVFVKRAVAISRFASIVSSRRSSFDAEAAAWRSRRGHAASAYVCRDRTKAAVAVSSLTSGLYAASVD